MIYAPVSMNWDEGPAKRGADRIHIDEVVWTMWVWYMFGFDNLLLNSFPRKKILLLLKTMSSLY